jgi:thioredoxin-like negative regulator of GroEL
MKQAERKDPAKRDGRQEKEKAAEEKIAPRAQAAKTPLVQPVQPPTKESIPNRAENLVEVTDLNWEKTVEREKAPVAVMFYSPTCVFCHQMEPYFRTFANEFKGSALFARLNIMVSPWTAERYGVRSTPTFKFFCDGKPVQEMVGAIYPALLRRALEEVLVHGKECVKNSTLIDYEITGYG